ncbi:MAG: DUF692 domain-containing protein [Leptothrix sp. (in: b-proteobacteria)]
MPPCLAGIGLRQPHYAQLLQERPALAFLEVHSENFFAPGGAARAVLHQAREHYPLSLHGVGLGLGSAAGLDPWHLDRLADLVAELEPVRVSDHASFSRAPLAVGQAVTHANDLLPVARTRAALDILVGNVQQVQERLRRPILVENISAYVAWKDVEMDEPSFFKELVRRSGCQILLDVNNLVVNALNAGDDDAQAARSAIAWVRAIDPASVGELHLAGYHQGGADELVIDDHGSRVHAPVWQVYRETCRHLGAVPTLIEWDTALPELAVLLDEAAQAETLMAAATAPAAVPARKFA